MKVAELVWQFSEPVVRELGCTIWDVEYVREGGEWFLRIYIDKDGGVGIDDCEAVSRAIDPILDEKDPIAESYTFEVCSAGIERVLKRPGDFQQFLGHQVAVKLYRPKNGAKEHVGTLSAYGEDGSITLDTPAGPVTFEKAEVAQCRLRVEF